jgi:energy-coupling factor transporter transmembrane protein EcfT
MSVKLVSLAVPNFVIFNVFNWLSICSSLPPPAPCETKFKNHRFCRHHYNKGFPFFFSLQPKSAKQIGRWLVHWNIHFALFSGITVLGAPKPLPKLSSTVLGLVIEILHFLMLMFFTFSSTDSSHLNSGFPTHRAPSGLRRIRFLQRSNSCILKS